MDTSTDRKLVLGSGWGWR